MCVCCKGFVIRIRDKGFGGVWLRIKDFQPTPRGPRMTRLQGLTISPGLMMHERVDQARPEGLHVYVLLRFYVSG